MEIQEIEKMIEETKAQIKQNNANIRKLKEYSLQLHADLGILNRNLKKTLEKQKREGIL